MTSIIFGAEPPQQQHHQHQSQQQYHHHQYHYAPMQVDNPHPHPYGGNGETTVTLASLTQQFEGGGGGGGGGGEGEGLSSSFSPLPPPTTPALPDVEDYSNFITMESAGVFPRVAHRHMYLWIEQQIEAKEKAGKRNLTCIDSLDEFREEVRVANEENKHYSHIKLQELIDKAPPYSLLYNRNLNMSTNVLKRWNRSNGMINWFLRRINRGPPTAADVIQVARVHLARTLMKRSDCSHLFTNSKDMVLGKRPRVSAGMAHGHEQEDDDIEQTGPTPITASSIDELFEYLKANYQSTITKEAVANAVCRNVWCRDGDSYQPNIRRLDGWSPENGCWQHFAHYCNEHHVKHDQYLFEFLQERPREAVRSTGEVVSTTGRRPRVASGGAAAATEAVLGARKPRGYGGGGGRAGGGKNRGRAMTPPAMHTTTGPQHFHQPGPPALPFSPSSHHQQHQQHHTSTYPHDHPMYGQGGGGTAAAMGGGGGAGYSMVVHPTKPPALKRKPLREIFMEFRLNLIRRVTSLSSAQLFMDVHFLGSKCHDWNDEDIKQWSDKSIQSAELLVLFPYFMRVDSSDSGVSAPRSIMVGHPITGYVQQVGNYTFSYGEDRFLSICAYLVGDGKESRFFGKYILSTRENILSTYGYAPVSLDPRGKSPTFVHKDDLASFQLWWLAETSAARKKVTGKTLPPHPKELAELLVHSARTPPGVTSEEDHQQHQLVSAATTI